MGAQTTQDIYGVAVIASSTEAPNPNGEGHSLIATNIAGGFVGIGGVVSVTTVSDITKAFIASSQINTKAQLGYYSPEVIVNAHANDYLLVISGGVAGGAVALGGTVDRTTISSQTSAFISSSDESGQYPYPTAPSVVYGNGGVQVTTETFETVDMTVLGVVGGAVALAGAVSVVNIDATNNAFVHDSDVYAEGNLDITANDTPTISTKVGVLDGGAVGAGASVSVNTIQNTVQAEDLGGDLNATVQVDIAATSNESIAPFVGTGSLGGVALAGAVAVDTITTTTQALVEDGSRPALINQDPSWQKGGAYAFSYFQQVIISASDTALLNGHTGTAAIGAVGVGASVDVGAIRNRTVAAVGNDSQIYSLDNVEIESNANRTIDSLVVAFTGGVVGLSGAVSVQSLGANTDPTAATEFNRTAQSNPDGSLLNQTDNSMQTPNVTNAINYQTSGTAPDAAQAGQDVSSLGQETADGDVSAITSTDRITGAFVDDAPSAADGASIVTGAITIQSTNLYHVQQTTGDAALGLGAAGAGIGVASVTNNTQAYVGNYDTLQATGPITIAATDQDSQTTPTQLTSIGGAAGLLALSANVATLNVTSNTSAELHDDAAILGGGAVTIAATQQSNLNVTGQGYGLALADAGAVITNATVTANVNASVGNGVTIGTVASKVGSLSVTTTANNTVDAAAQVGHVGLVAGNYAQATATVTLSDNADNGDSTVAATGAVALNATSTANTQANSVQLVGAIVGGGASQPTTKILGSVSAFLAAGAAITAGSLSVTAEANNTALAEGAAFGVGVVDGTAAGMTAQVNVDTSAYIDAAVVQLIGGANVTATSNSQATADSGQLSVGGVAVGAGVAISSVDDTTQAFVSGATITAGGGVTVSATALGQSTSVAYALDGGVIAGDFNTADATTDPQCAAWIAASVNAGGNVRVTADAETAADAHVYALSVGGFAAGESDSSATDAPMVNAYFGNGAIVTAGGAILVQASHNTSAGTGAQAIAEAPGVAFAGYDGAKPIATAGASVNSSVNPSALLQAGGSISISADSINTAYADAVSFFGGGLGLAPARPPPTFKVPPPTKPASKPWPK